MIKTFFAGAFFLLLLAACTAARNGAAAGNNLDGAWTLSVFEPAQKKTLSELFGARIAELQFDSKTMKISGTTGCNRFTGTYTADTANLLFSQNLALTRMACAGYDEAQFVNALKRINRYQLIEGQLELMQNDEIVMIFAKKI